MNLIRRTIREDITIDYSLADSLPSIMGDVGQLEQVVMNLAVNAQDAMPEGGQLKFKTSCKQLDEAYLEAFEDLLPGLFVLLEVSDTGTGIDPSIQRRIFEPFFTTKAVYQGTGLGLSTAYGIVQQHSGSIKLESEPGKGTRFTILIPASGTQKSMVEVDSRMDPEYQKGNETVLLVEDNPQVRLLTLSILERYGYTVLPAAAGPEALDILKSCDQHVDLLLTDIVMPGMNGIELYGKTTQIEPGLKVLFMSGYTDDIIPFDKIKNQGFPFIQKPFPVQALTQVIRTILDKQKPSPEEYRV